MKRFIFISIVAIALLSTFTIKSQDKLLKLKDAVIGNNRYMYPEYLHSLRWQPEGYNFSYIKDDKLVSESIKNAGLKEIVNLKKLNSVIKKDNYAEFKKFPSYKWIDNHTITFTKDTSLVAYDIKSKKVVYDIKYVKKASNLDFCKKNRSIAYTIENNLFIVDNNEKVSAVTNDTNIAIVNGGNYVHRDEFGIYKGTFWSPEGNYLAYYHEDMSMVTDYPLVDITKRIAETKNIKYPMAGMKSEEVTLGVFNLKTKKTIYLKTGKPVEQFLTNIAWSPDEKYIYIAVLNREQNYMKFNKYSVETGYFIKTLFEEQNEKYVEPLNKMEFLPNNNSKFIWFSEKDGYNQIYLYNTEGTLIRQLTKGNWEVTKFIGFDKEGENIYYVSNERNPIERDVYKLNIETLNKILLTKEHGTHKPLFCFDKTHFIDEFSSTEVPRNYYITNNTGNILRTVFSAENPLKDYNIGEMSIFTIKSADSVTDLYARMIKPMNFDSTQKYPAIVYVYGGPHSQLVRNTWMGSSWVWQYYMAQKGYVMLTLDNRGTDYRGRGFEDIIHRKLGKAEVADQKEGINFLYSLAYVDTNRIGLHGWSYGGFMTISLMQKYPDVFKVGVAGGPVTDWKYYEVMYGERYMDMPQENPEGYSECKVTDKVKKVKGRLMIIHGAIDKTVVWQNSLTYIRECVKEGVPVDYFVYPRSEHNVRGKDRIHLMQKVTQYFDDFL